MLKRASNRVATIDTAFLDDVVFVAEVFAVLAVVLVVVFGADADVFGLLAVVLPADLDSSAFAFLAMSPKRSKR